MDTNTRGQRIASGIVPFSPRDKSTRVSALTIVLQVQDPTTALVKCKVYWYRHEQKLGEVTLSTSVKTTSHLRITGVQVETGQ